MKRARAFTGVLLGAAFAFGLWLAWGYPAAATDTADTDDNAGAADAGQIALTSSAFRTPVVELYTSEGCSSCPPADDWLRRLGAALDQEFSAVPLAFHVDYWNYLGWTDPYSKPAFSKRQRAAAALNLRRGVYTPEFVVDGRETRGGNAILRAIRDANSQNAEATIVARVTRRSDDRLGARIEVDNRSGRARAHAHVAIFESGITRKIGGGENHGKTLRHDFVVRHWSRAIAIRPGFNRAAFEIEIPADWRRANLGLAVMVFDPASGETLQAVRAPLASLFAG